MKYFNFKRYKFSTVTKNLITIGNNFLAIFQFKISGNMILKKFIDIQALQGII